MNFPVLKAKRMYRQVSDAIIQQIRDGQFLPGEALPAERDLARQMGISRSSVREALVALEIAGWVEIRVGHGVFVNAAFPQMHGLTVETNDASPEDFLEARLLFEGELAATAAKSATDAQLTELRAVLQQMMSDVRNDTTFLDHDRRFHLLIAEMTGNTVLVEMICNLWNRRYAPTFRRLEAHYGDPGIVAANNADHAAIVEALCRRDPRAARAAMHRHLKNVMAWLLRRAA